MTAGNAWSIDNGAAGLLVCSEEFAEQHALPVRAIIQGYATGAVDPKEVMMAPVTAVQHLQDRVLKPASAYGLIELNEAFARRRWR